MALSVQGDGEASAADGAAALLTRADLPVIGGILTDITGANDEPILHAIERGVAHLCDTYYDVKLSSFGTPGYMAARPDRIATVPCLH
jgi:hypothetical protein